MFSKKLNLFKNFFSRWNSWSSDFGISVYSSSKYFKVESHLLISIMDFDNESFQDQMDFGSEAFQDQGQ